MADVSDPSELFDLELHEDDKAQDSDDDRIELDDVSTWIHTNIHVYYIYKKINYAATATAAGAAFAHPCPPPLEIFLLCLPSLCLYVIVCIRLYVCVCVYRCSQKFAFSLFGKPNSQAAYLLRKCSDHLTKTRRRTR